jgi:hypothetical protein
MTTLAEIFFPIIGRNIFFLFEQQTFSSSEECRELQLIFKAANSLPLV